MPQDIEKLKQQPVSLFSGIADPDSFHKLAAVMGFKPDLWFAFGDHHHFSRNDLNRIASQSRKQNIGLAITTVKDSCRIDTGLLPDSGFNFLVLEIQLKIISPNEEDLHNRLRGIFTN